MSRQVLQMKYHPAKKEVAFIRVISGKETKITGGSGSVLSKITRVGRLSLGMARWRKSKRMTKTIMWWRCV